MNEFKSCPVCQTFVPRSARFCVTCGRPFASSSPIAPPNFGPVGRPNPQWQSSTRWSPPVPPAVPGKKTSRSGRIVVGILAFLFVLGVAGAVMTDRGAINNEEVAADNGSPVTKPTQTAVATRTPTIAPTATAIPVPPLEILSVRSETTGFGGAYAYVRVTNHTDETINYVGVEGMCYDNSGVRRGDGLGNTTNVAPGETVEITVIFMSSDGCTTVKVQFDDLTGWFI